MGVEIERKFLVAGEPWHGHPGRRLQQGYLASTDGVAVRVRVAGDQAWLTVKGPAQAGVRVEVEVDVPVDEAQQLLGLCGTRRIDKVRYLVPHAGHTWEVDVFDGLNAGLVVAEVELDAVDEAVTLPAWVTAEVTDDDRYANASLSRRPFSRWPAEGGG